MNLLKRLIDIGTKKQSDVIRIKQIRFTNSVSLIICYFIVQNILLSIYYQQPLIVFIQVAHLIMIALVPFFNYKNQRVLASAWFSSAAIFFVSIYSVVFTLESLNFTFLPMIMFMQFFLFSPAEKKYIIIFVAITALCFAGVLVTANLYEPLVSSLPQGLLKAQRWNTLVGLPMLSTAIGIYAFYTIKRAEEEAAKEKEDLKAVQKQLIQSEKMASLGELTAGIAHEIQNPLNFVNNFSEVSNEMFDEMKDELATGNLQLATEIADDIKQNLEKINHHGKRADAIVKGMLQHSKTSTGLKEPIDINKLADEYLRLAYHGMRAKDKSFNAEIKTDFDNSIGKINVVPQDIGRVLLNLFNNAFYATNEKQKVESLTRNAEYKPLVSVQTKSINSPTLGGGGGVEIKVADNGNGISQNIVDKIFQPFFTTKPTGQGTGLGLGLAYDIIKTHGGEISVNANEGEETVVIVWLPIV